MYLHVYTVYYTSYVSDNHIGKYGTTFERKVFWLTSYSRGWGMTIYSSLGAVVRAARPPFSDVSAGALQQHLPLPCFFFSLFQIVTGRATGIQWHFSVAAHWTNNNEFDKVGALRALQDGESHGFFRRHRRLYADGAVAKGSPSTVRDWYDQEADRGLETYFLTGLTISRYDLYKLSVLWTGRAIRFPLVVQLARAFMEVSTRTRVLLLTLTDVPISFLLFHSNPPHLI